MNRFEKSLYDAAVDNYLSIVKQLREDESGFFLSVAGGWAHAQGDSGLSMKDVIRVANEKPSLDVKTFSRFQSSVDSIPYLSLIDVVLPAVDENNTEDQNIAIIHRHWSSLAGGFLDEDSTMNIKMVSTNLDNDKTMAILLALTHDSVKQSEELEVRPSDNIAAPRR